MPLCVNTHSSVMQRYDTNPALHAMRCHAAAHCADECASATDEITIHARDKRNDMWALGKTVGTTQWQRGTRDAHAHT